MMNQGTITETTHSANKNLYKLGGAAALIVVVLTLSEVIGLTPRFTRTVRGRRSSIVLFDTRASPAPLWSLPRALR